MSFHILINIFNFNEPHFKATRSLFFKVNQQYFYSGEIKKFTYFYQTNIGLVFVYCAASGC